MTTLPIVANDNEIVLESNEISYRLPIEGVVQVNKITPFPGKVSLGKTKRGDSVVADEFFQDDWRGGLLINYLDEDAHIDRFWWSSGIGTSTKNKLYLALLDTSIGAPSGETADCDYLFVGKDTNGLDVLYADFNGKLYYYKADQSGWSAELQVAGPASMGSIPTSHVAYSGTDAGNAGAVYLFNGTGDYYKVLSGVLTKLTPGWSPKYGTTFDINPSMKVIAINSSGQMKVTNTPETAGSWVETAGGRVYDRTITGIYPYRDANDNPMIVVGTSDGLVAVDVWAQTNYITSLQTIRNSYAGRSLKTWSDGNLYFPDGLSLWRYPREGQITNIGLDRDDKLPTFIRGKITQLTPLSDYLAAVVDNTAVNYYTALTGTVTTAGGNTIVEGDDAGVPPVPTTLFTTELIPHDVIRIGGVDYTVDTITDLDTLNTTTNVPAWTSVKIYRKNQDILDLIDAWGTSTFPSDTLAGYSGIFFYNGDGWHEIYISSATSTGIKASCFSIAYNEERRFFFADKGTVKYIIIPEGTYDPTLDAAANFVQSGTFYTSWLRFGYSEIVKLMSSFRSRCVNITSTEKITVSYAYNDNEDSYYTLGTIDNTTIDSNGRVVFYFPSLSDYPSVTAREGLQIYSIKLKFDFERSSSDTTLTPVMLFYGLRFKYEPDILWGYTFTVLGDGHYDLGTFVIEPDAGSARITKIWEQLKRAIEARKIFKFYYRSNDTETSTWVLLSNISGIRRGGTDDRSSFTLSVLELE